MTTASLQGCGETRLRFIADQLNSCWYVRFEVQKRFGAFYLLAMLAGGMSSLLALGLSKMKGLGGLNGWRWIFVSRAHLFLCSEFHANCSLDNRK